jgi:hypothetical protein
MRPDTNVSTINLKLDPAVKTYASLVAMDARFGNPIHIVAAHLFTDSLRALRSKMTLAERRTARAPPSEEGVVIIANPLGGGIAQGGAKADPSAQLKQAGEGASADKQRQRRAQVARNRWWLAAMLLAHPNLAQFRVRGPQHEHEHHGHSVGEVAYHFTAGIFC